METAITTVSGINKCFLTVFCRKVTFFSVCFTCAVVLLFEKSSLAFNTNPVVLQQPGFIVLSPHPHSGLLIVFNSREASLPPHQWRLIASPELAIKKKPRMSIEVIFFKTRCFIIGWLWSNIDFSDKGKIKWQTSLNDLHHLIVNFLKKAWQNSK